MRENRCCLFMTSTGPFTFGYLVPKQFAILQYLFNGNPHIKRWIFTIISISPVSLQHTDAFRDIGHMQVSLTMQLYVHSNMETKKKEMEKMDAYL